MVGGGDHPGTRGRLPAHCRGEIVTINEIDRSHHIGLTLIGELSRGARAIPSPSMGQSPQHYRAQADRLREQAKSVSEPAEKITLLELAINYDLLAELVERRDEGRPRSTKHGRG
jgi:hypothetical protein